MEFGQRLQELLHEKHLKASGLAKHLGTNQTTVSGWLRGGRSPSFEYIIPICEFLDVNPYYLLTGQQPLPQNEALSDDRRQLLRYYDQLSDFERGALVTELRLKTQERISGAN